MKNIGSFSGYSIRFANNSRSIMKTIKKGDSDMLLGLLIGLTVGSIGSIVNSVATLYLLIRREEKK